METMGAMVVEIAQKVKFIDLCGVLEKIKGADGIQSKEKHLRRYIESFAEFSKKFSLENGNDCESSFYCILRCLIPNADKSRSSYNIRIPTMGNLYVKILNLSPNGDDAQKLFYKTTVNGCKDYADVVFSVMKSRASDVPSKLTVRDVHNLLDIISDSDRKTVENELTRFIQTASAMEQKWFIRIILKSMHLGIGEQKIFGIYHPQAKEYFARNSNLRQMCLSIEKGDISELTANVVKPFQYIQAMLCKRINEVNEVENLYKIGALFLEPKMDGERFQLHMHDEEFKYFSRSGKDYTKSFGKNICEGNLTPLISKLFINRVKNIVLDGEMMVWDKNTGSFRVKGENIDVKWLHSGGSLRPCFIAFDVLYLNDKSYLDVPYVERVATLEKLLKEEIGILGYCKRTKIQDPEHFRNLFNEALRKNEEGVVFKNQISVYYPGSRNGGWYKLKPDYIEGIVSDFDLLIIGGFYNRTKIYTKSYIVGVCKRSSKEDEMPIFHSVGNVSSQSLSLPERKLLSEMLWSHWSTESYPNYLEFGETKPDAWINPKDSVILQVRASELAPNSAFKTNYCLRFPRIDSVRRDKIWSECMTLEEYENFYKKGDGVKKIAKRYLDLADLNESKRMKVTSKNSLANAYTTKFNAAEINKVSDELSGISICILSAYKKGNYAVDQLKEIVIKHGGKVVENPLLDSKKCFCIAGDITLRVKNIKDTGLYNIVSLNWLLRAFKDDTVRADLVRPRPRDMISTTSEMKEELENHYDLYGDSYMEHVDYEEMELLLAEMESQNLKPLLDSEIKNLEQEMYNDNSPNFYRAIYGHFYSEGSCINGISQLAKLIFETRGGQTIDFKQTKQRKLHFYIFVDVLTTNKMQLKIWLDENYEKRLNVIKVISCDWIFQCDRNAKIIDVGQYLVKF